MKREFTGIYAANLWRYGSGEGSLRLHTRGYRRFVERLLRREGVRSVVDFGCGDWQSSRLIDWGGAHYLGLDVVDGVIEENRRRYGNATTEFRTLEALPEELPRADLLLVKDVLQHWPNATVAAFLQKLSGFRLVLVTNCVAPHGSTENQDIALGDFRPLDLRLPPFSWQAEKVYEFTNWQFPLFPFPEVRWKKMVLLQRCGGGREG